MTTVDMGPLVTWTLGLLETGTGRPIGDAASPADTSYPYGVLYVIDGTMFHGAPLVTPDADADIPVQVNSVGLRPEQARWMSDRVRRTLLARSASGAFQVNPDSPLGYTIADRQASGGPTLPIAEGPPEHQVFTISERFIIRVTRGD